MSQQKNENVSQLELGSTEEKRDVHTVNDETRAVGEHCVTDRPTPSGQATSGEILKLGDVEAYVSRPGSTSRSAARLLLLLSSGTGLRSINNRLQADKFARHGYIVVMPDLFHGDAAPNIPLVDVEENSSSIIEDTKLRVAEYVKSFRLDMWLARHTRESVLPVIASVLKALKTDFADNLVENGGIYVVGYCFGGKYALLLGSEEVATSIECPKVKAVAIAHASDVGREDFKGVGVPISMACVENDPIFPDDVRNHGVGILASSGIEHETIMYPGMPHGFAIVGDYPGRDDISAAQEKTHSQFLSWLESH